MPVIYEPVLANPAPVGLYQVAIVLDRDDPTRLADGVLVRSINCGPSGVWPIEYCAGPPAEPKGGDRAPDHLFTGLVVWAADDCGLLADLNDQQARARQLLRLHERRHVEEHAATVLTAEAGPPNTATGLVAALGAVEEQLAQFGYPGVVHAAPHLAAAAHAVNLVVRDGARLLTPSGNQWAFGAGYVDLGDTLFGTGPVVVHRGPVVESTGPFHRRNERLVVVEREVLVSWECVTLAVTIA
ncbi:MULTISPECIES: hypothetical protein [Rhodococcus]|uniref:hypothetical protein n=1 Tax=Rhodococcus TaxID=1827 RepID=UPI001E350F05|nr:hypothetical protein [Rhodococcus pyridinivorans]MCD2119436.1 hypothetical protein [Rhodococcus pyridinivorans]MCZ4628337.1 hypothetical protein [Rhodococcus pyridinivorans]MCZ4649602.1 hypothetical protein [Rhodococcus pyridinivorans]MDJ0483684.1 hypothetical protein [Rhodococcus pyridinivorans]MDV7255665.1 hypothetical protein [Rhodococcus pyridinivorans]